MGFMEIVTWIAFGLIAGVIAKLLMPGKDPGGIIVTILLGIAGALVGGFIGNAMGFGWNANVDGGGLLDWRNLMLAIGGSFLLLLAYRAFRLLAGPAESAEATHPARTGYSAFDMPSAPNLTDSIKNAVTPDVVQKLSSAVGENPGAIRKALDAMIPAVMAGAANQAATPTGAARLLEMAKESAEDTGDAARELASHASAAGIETMARSGQSFLGTLFGDKLSGLVNYFSKFAGISGTAVNSLLGVVSNLVKNVLGQQVLKNGLSATGLSTLLGSQKGFLSRLLPAGLTEVPGFSALADLGTSAGAAVHTAARRGEEAVRGAARDVYRAGADAAQEVKPWASALVPLLVMGLAVAALPFMLRGCAAGRDGAVAKGPTNNQPIVRAPDIRDPNVPDPGLRVSGYRPELKPIKITLPSGVSLEVPEGSFLNGLHKFLADTGDAKSRSFVFENLTFDGPAIKTSPESENSVTVIGTLLKSFPHVQLRIDGHTDAHPDAAESRRLALARATAVRDLLTRAGVPAERITIEAFGHEKPIAPNDTEENRMKNRRVELTIVKK
jgi:outer membrane protein OmpA-like peptidoglycan-associated protein/uncharacterized membrane protein YeaQ/YmgE (transglycosylase-associated protein family)